MSRKYHINTVYCIHSVAGTLKTVSSKAYAKRYGLDCSGLLRIGLDWLQFVSIYSIQHFFCPFTYHWNKNTAWVHCKIIPDRSSRSRMWLQFLTQHLSYFIILFGIGFVLFIYRLAMDVFVQDNCRRNSVHGKN